MSFSLKSLCSNVLPAGTYKAVVEDIKFKSVGGTTTRDLQINYRVADGAQKGKTLIETLPENFFPSKLAPFAKAIGLDMNREFSTVDEVLNYVVKSAKGSSLMIEVVIKVFNSNEYNNVKSYAALPGSSTTTEDVLEDFKIDPIKGEKPHIDDLPFDETPETPGTEPSIETEDLF